MKNKLLLRLMYVNVEGNSRCDEKYKSHTHVQTCKLQNKLALRPCNGNRNL